MVQGMSGEQKGFSSVFQNMCWSVITLRPGCLLVV